MTEYKNLSLEELLKHARDNAAWYWIGMSYWERSDIVNAAVWFEKAMNDPGNKWEGKSRLLMGVAHANNGIPNSSRDKALDLFEQNLTQNPNSVMSRLNAGFLYCKGTETRRDLDKGKALIEQSIEQLIKEDGNLDFLKQIELYDIAIMFEGRQMFSIAINYYTRVIKECNSTNTSDRKLIEKTKEAISECRRRTQMLGDQSRYSQKHLEISKTL